MQAVGMVKLVANKRDDSLIGAHIIGPMAGELISELGTRDRFFLATKVTAPDDDVVDAEFEEVRDEDKKAS